MPGTDLPERARNLDIFLDALAAQAGTDASWVLDERFEALLEEGDTDTARRIRALGRKNRRPVRPLRSCGPDRPTACQAVVVGTRGSTRRESHGTTAAISSRTSRTPSSSHGRPAPGGRSTSRSQTVSVPRPYRTPGAARPERGRRLSRPPSRGHQVRDA